MVYAAKGLDLETVRRHKLGLKLKNGNYKLNRNLRKGEVWWMCDYSSRTIREENYEMYN